MPFIKIFKVCLQLLMANTKFSDNTVFSIPLAQNCFIISSISGRVLVVHSRLVTPRGPGDGIPFPSSCYIYQCSYLRGPFGYSVCSEDPQHPPFRKAHSAVGQDVITTTVSSSTSFNLCFPVRQTNLLKYASECF